MITAVKNALKIQARVQDGEVLMDLVEMEEIVFLFRSWLKNKQFEAQAFLQSSSQLLPDTALQEFFAQSGWTIL